MRVDTQNRKSIYFGLKVILSNEKIRFKKSAQIIAEDSSYNCSH